MPSLFYLLINIVNNITKFYNFKVIVEHSLLAGNIAVSEE